MSSHFIQFGKYRFVCGLFWQSLSRPRELRKEAAELAKKVGCDMVVLRQEYSTAQAGLLQSGAGLGRQAHYSLAAAVAGKLARDGASYDGENQPVHNWLAAFRLPDGQWVYFAVRDANFLPNGDFLGSREEVFERLHGDYGLGGWNMVFGDAELENFGFHNFSEKTIDELLGLNSKGPLKVQASWKLRPVQARLSRPALLGAGTAAIVLAGGLSYVWTQHQARVAGQAAEQAELLRQAELRRAALAAPPQPWRSAPVPLALAHACLQHLQHMTAGGWLLKDYGCGPQAVRYVWSRQESAIALLLAQVPAASVDLSGDNATLSLSLPLALPARAAEDLLSAQQLLPSLQSRLQLMGLGMTLRRAPAPPRQPPPTSGVPNGTVLPNWTTYTYSVSASALSPLEVAGILSAPGVELNNINYRAGLWFLEGVIHAK